MAGAVKNPGVYPLMEGDRLVDGVEAAGGATDDANLEEVNLAMRVEDEGYYYIPAKAPRPAADIVADIVTETTEDAFPTPQFPRRQPTVPPLGIRPKLLNLPPPLPNLAGRST